MGETEDEPEAMPPVRPTTEGELAGVVESSGKRGRTQHRVALEGRRAS